MNEDDVIRQLIGLCRDLKAQAADLQSQLHAHRITLKALLQLHATPHALLVALRDEMGDRPESLSAQRAAEAGESLAELVRILEDRIDPTS
jgi:hypothetical protein